MTGRQLGLGWAEPLTPAEEPLDAGAVLLRGFALTEAPALVLGVERAALEAPFRHLATPGGQVMSVAMTCVGPLGWHSDRRGYRYVARDPAHDRPWPAFPGEFLALARRAAAQAGFPGFTPDSCLINRYVPGARLTLHQDRDERELEAPIVSVSLGLPCTFLWGGLTRAERPRRWRLVHGDVVVWGGPSRLRFHGVAPLAEGEHPLTGALRYNLTFRRAA